MTIVTKITTTLSPEPPLLTYEEMILTKGVFAFANADGTPCYPGRYIINQAGCGNSETSQHRPLFVHTSGYIESMSTSAWRKYYFKKTTEKISITFSNEE